MQQERSYQVTGVAPLLMHNVRLANPRDKYSRDMKKITSNRKKTDADLMRLAELEFHGGLYLGEKGKIVLPSLCWEAGIIEAAKKTKMGKAAKSAVFCDDDMILEFDGPKTPEERWADPNCADARMVKVQSSRVLRTRPIFRGWSGTVTFQYNDSIISTEKLDDLMVTMGCEIGVGDYRPRYGRFQAKPC